MFELEEIYEFADKEAFPTLEEFLDYAKSGEAADVYAFVNKDAFPTLDEFTSILKKKEETTVSPGEVVEEITSVVTDEPTTVEDTPSDISATQEPVVEEESTTQLQTIYGIPIPWLKTTKEPKEKEEIVVDEEFLKSQKESVKKLQEAPTITPQQQIDIDQENAEDFAEEGFFDTVGKYYNATKKIWEAGGVGPEEGLMNRHFTKWIGETLPEYRSDKKKAVGKAVQQLTEEFGPEVELTPEQILEKAKEINKEEIITSKREYNLEEYIGDLDDEEKDNLEKYAGMSLAKHNKQLALNMVQLKTLDKEYGVKSEKYSKESEAVEKMPDGNAKIQAEQRLQKGYNQLQEDYKKVLLKQGEVNNNQKDIQELSVEADLLKRNYNVGVNVAGKFANSAADLWVGMGKAQKDILVDLPLDYATMLTNLALSNTGIDITDSKVLTSLKEVADIAKKTSAEAEKVLDGLGEFTETHLRDKLRKARRVDDLSMDGSWQSITDWSQWTGDLFAEQAPQLALLAFTGGQSGLLALGSSAYGNKLNSLEKEVGEGLEDYSPWHMRMASAMVGVGEYLSEKVTLGIIKKSMPSSRMYSAFTKANKGKVPDSFKTGVKAAMKRKFTSLGRGAWTANEEGMSELYAQVVENVADRYVLGKEVGLFDNVKDAYVSGVFIGGGIQALGRGGVGGLLIKPFINDKSKVISKNITEIQNLSKGLENFRKQQRENPSDLSWQTVIDAALTTIAKKEIENGKMILEGLNVINGLSPSEIREVSNMEVKFLNIKEEYNQIRTNQNITEDQRGMLLEGLDAKYNTLVKRKAEILDTGKAEDPRYVINNKEVTAEEMKAYIAKEGNLEKLAKGEGSVNIINDETLQKEFQDKIKPTVTEKVVEEVVPKEAKAEEVKEEKDIKNKSVSELEQRQVEIEDKLQDPKLSKEFDKIDKELEKREWESVMNTELENVDEVLDGLVKKEKEKPDGFGTYIEGFDIRDSREVVERYSKENKGKLSDAEITKDFTDALRGRPTTNYGDALKLREAVNEAANRGITMDQLLQEAVDIYTREGYDKAQAKSVVKGMIEPIFKKAKPKPKKAKAEEVKEEVEVKEEPKVEPKVEEVKEEIKEEEYSVHLQGMFEGGGHVQSKSTKLQKFVVEGINIKDPRATQGTETEKDLRNGLKGYVHEQGGKKVFTLIDRTTKDHVGRPGAHTVSMVFPKETTNTLKSVEDELIALNKKVVEARDKNKRFGSPQSLFALGELDAEGKIITQQKPTPPPRFRKGEASGMAKRMEDAKRKLLKEGAISEEGGEMVGINNLIKLAKDIERDTRQGTNRVATYELNFEEQKKAWLAKNPNEDAEVVVFMDKMIDHQKKARMRKLKETKAVKEETKGITAEMDAALATGLFEGAPKDKGKKDVTRVIDALKKAFPNTRFFTDQASWDAIMAQDGVKKYVKEGETVYGLTTDGDIYLNPKVLDMNTPIHEAGHLWVDLIREGNPELYNRGLELVEGTQALKDATKTYGKTRKAKEEALAVLIGNKGETIANAGKKSKFQDFMLAMWEYLQKKFPSLRALTAAEVGELTLDEFVGGAVKDILGGAPLKKKAKPRLRKEGVDFSGRRWDALQAEIDILIDEFVKFAQDTYNLSEDKALRIWLLPSVTKVDEVPGKTAEDILKEFPQSKQLDKKIEERNNIGKRTILETEKILEKHAKKQGLSEVGIEELKEALGLLTKTDSELMLSINLLEDGMAFSTENIKSIVKKIARAQLKSEGKDAEGVFGPDSGWTKDKQRTYIEDLKKQVEAIGKKVVSEIGSKAQMEETTKPRLRKEKSLLPEKYLTIKQTWIDDFESDLDKIDERVEDEEIDYLEEQREREAVILNALQMHYGGKYSDINYGDTFLKLRLADHARRYDADVSVVVGGDPLFDHIGFTSRDTDLQAMINEINEKLSEKGELQLKEDAKPRFRKKKETPEQRMERVLDGVITKAQERVKKEGAYPKQDKIDRVYTSALKYLQGSKWYEDANDIQREEAVRDLKKKLKIRMKGAPTVAKLFQIAADKTISVTAAQLRKWMARDLKEGYKIGQKDAKTAQRELNKLKKELQQELHQELREMMKVAKVKLTDRQVMAIINKFNKTNLLNNVMRERFISYVEKVLKDATYAKKVTEAVKLQKQIKKRSKNKDIDALLAQLGKDFAQIDPSLVEDIDTYLSQAKSMAEGLQFSRRHKDQVKWRMSPQIQKMESYIDEELRKQEAFLFKQKQEEFKELLGVDPEGLTYKEMMEVLEGEKEIDPTKETETRKNIQKMFDVYRSVISEMISTNTDPFTGESLNITDKQKKTIRDFMEMDLDRLTIKEAIRAADALNNFATSQITSGMDSVLATYTGALGAWELVKKGMVAHPLKLYWSKLIGRMSSQYITSLPLQIERMFKSQRKARLVKEEMGLTAIINGGAKSEVQSRSIDKQYVDKFFGKKVNGQAFNTAYNAMERGMLAFMRRTELDPDQQAIEFKRRKDLIQSTIKKLREEGTEEEIKMADTYEELFNKLLKDSNSFEDMYANLPASSSLNLEAVEWWTNEWAKIYGELSDVSLGVYNSVLDKDLNYTPDVYKKLKQEPTEEDKKDVLESAYISYHNTPYAKKTGVLQKATKPKMLPADRYISLDFDLNNSRAMLAALMDINTAKGIRQWQGFYNSKSYKKLIPSNEDRSMLTRRVNEYITRKRGKDFVPQNDLSKFSRSLNVIASTGVSRVLAGFFQSFKQTIPVAMNTISNAGSLDLEMITNNPAVNAFINRSGYGIANRGLASQSTIDSLNQLITKAAESKGEKLMRAIEKTNEFYLNLTLVKADVFIARASWITYYTKHLKAQGIDTQQIDWNTHKVNKKAADYAQDQLDRQQYVSDKDLQGDLFTSKQPGADIIRKGFFAFMSFLLNQKARMYSDLAIVTSKTANKTDKIIAARSLGGLAAESITFNLIGYGITQLLRGVADMIMDNEPEEEEEEKRRFYNSIGRITNLTTDLLSPIPISDTAVLWAVNSVLDIAQSDKSDKEKIQLYNKLEKDVFERMGIYGIALTKGLDFKDLVKGAYSGELTTEYMGQSTTRKLSPEAQETFKLLVPVAALYNLGVLPSEVGSVIRYIIKIAQKKSLTLKQSEKEGATGGASGIGGTGTGIGGTGTGIGGAGTGIGGGTEIK